MKKHLKNIRWALYQQKVIPGDPKANTDDIIEAMKKAAQRKRQILIVPEMSVPGYLIGDTWEDEAFIRDVMYHNERIREASKVYGIIVIFGSALPDFSKKNEKGLFRLANCAFVAQDGRWIDIISKTLFPNYRYFDDARNFFSKRLELAERNEEVATKAEINSWREQLKVCADVLRPVEVMIGKRKVKLGIILCEDMWHGDYPVNPAKILAQMGAEIIINLSASPWGWQKNRKRHSVVAELFEVVDRKPFIYVNNVGPQNNGKNFLAFDGSSTVYDEHGKIVFVINPYEAGVRDFSFQACQEIKYTEESDVVQMRLAIESVIRDFFDKLPPEQRKVHIGLSGGVDSAVSAAIHINVLGKENVFLYYMPMEGNSTGESKTLAQKFADNFGMTLQIIPIKESVDVLAKATGAVPKTLAYENLQAKVRGMILTTMAQKHGGFVPANFNKVEAAFGYGTLYGDIAGYLAPLGDLTKREVRQLGHHYNVDVFKKEMIPDEIITRIPSAELNEGQFDPFDYGDLNRRGYHDEMVRAFTEFRKNPEWFLDRYYAGTLEKDLLLEEGTLHRLFPTAEAFIADLKLNWQRFYFSVFKRVQAPPIIVISRRAFGYDYREFIGKRPMTERFKELEEMILKKQNKKSQIYSYGGSFNPACIHHQEIAEYVVGELGSPVSLRPCWLRPDKKSVNSLDPMHRLEIARIAFANIPGVFLDEGDFVAEEYFPTIRLEEEYRKDFPDSEIWHIFGTDLFKKNYAGIAEIMTWDDGENLFKNSNFVLLERPGYELSADEYPPHCKLIKLPKICGSGTDVREMIRRGESTDKYLDKKVRAYIDEHHLYR